MIANVRHGVSAGQVIIWDASSGSLIRALEGPDEGIMWLQWHPRGPILIAGSEDFTCWMWNAEKNKSSQVGHYQQTLPACRRASCSSIQFRASDLIPNKYRPVSLSVVVNKSIRSPMNVVLLQWVRNSLMNEVLLQWVRNSLILGGWNLS
jgi:WD40 repeat protein